MASLSAFTKSTVRLFKFIEEENNVEEIIKYMREIILTKNINIGIPIIIQKKASEIFDKNEQMSLDERFYCQNSPNLRKFNGKFICMS